MSRDATKTSAAMVSKQISPPMSEPKWSQEVRVAIEKGLALGPALVKRGRRSQHLQSSVIDRKLASTKGLSTDALVNAVVQLALQDLAVFVKEHKLTQFSDNFTTIQNLASLRHYQELRITSFTGNHTSLTNLVDSIRAGYSDRECASLLKTFSNAHKVRSQLIADPVLTLS